MVLPLHAVVLSIHGMVLPLHAVVLSIYGMVLSLHDVVLSLHGVVLSLHGVVLHSGVINLFDERIVYSPDKDAVCSKRGTTEIL